jgi:probable rRNA maturation factor
MTVAKKKKTTARAASPAVELEIQAGRSRAPRVSRAELRRWVEASLAAVPARGRGRRDPAMTLRFVGVAEGTRLNEGYRPGKAGPTNVLAFPGPDPRQLPPGEPVHLGDVVICLPVLRREAAAQGKSLRAHLAHLVVHGTLHLLGHDHELPRAARRMEALETRILNGLGFSDPYCD